MKIYKTRAEVEKDIENGVLRVNDDVTFECPISIEADITAYAITADYITANNIDAYNIDAYNITARSINAFDIDAADIKARDINAADIKANDIIARDINANNITASNISYYAFCLSYNGIKCSSITPRRTNHQEPICLDGELIITPKEQKTSNPGEITIDGAVYVLKEKDTDE